MKEAGHIMLATRIAVTLSAAALLMGPAAGWAAEPAGTAFTYQGRLTDAGSPANGQYDFEFTLCEDSGGASPVAGPISANDEQVANGLFTARLDFGAGVFTGDARWLKIGVRPAWDEVPPEPPFTPLTPPQELTPAPYALYALGGGGTRELL